LNSHPGFPGEQVEPFYFGPPDKPLFGCYHAPHAAASRDCGVVLCYPTGEEYIRFHRACRQLARQLSNAGFPVLRFDFYGCGDSSGSHQEGRIDLWLADLSTAVGELRRRAAVNGLCLVGLRLGGTLAMAAGAERGDVDGMVLWDPVVSGAAYTAELRAAHRALVWKAHVRPRRRAPHEDQTEMLGFPFSDALLGDLEGLDSMSIQRKPADHILVVESNRKASQRPLVEHLQRLGVLVEHQVLLQPPFWQWAEDFGRVLVPQRILQAMVRWVSEAHR
jgi:pimeloyl-ACP methyl ester carboxylesterase